MKILIVDDEQDILDNFNNILLPTKYYYKTTNNPVEAVNLIKKEYYDIVMLDVKMYPVDGLTILKEIREFNNSINVILISAYEEYSILAAAIDLHVYSFFKKPIDIKKMFAILREIESKIDNTKEKENEYEKMKSENERLKIEIKKLSSTGKLN